MNEQMANLLRELAAQLGTTAEHLWEVTVAQAAIEAYVLGWFLVFGCGLVATGISTIGLGWWWNYDRYQDRPYYGKGDSLFTVTGSGLVAVVLGVVLFLDAFVEYLTAAQNPEYWALQEILSKLGGAG